MRGLTYLRSTSRLLSLVLLFVNGSWQQKDPLNDFCRRFGHQSAVVDRKLYLDGGLVNWNPISQNNANYSNTWLLYNDLDTSPAGVGVPQLHANLSKNSSIPDVSGGVLWADDVNKRFYLYGGDYSGISPNPLNLLSYDVLYDQWEHFGPPDAPINSVSWGAGVSISELGQGYMLGGWLSNKSVPGWSGGPLATSTLIKYQMDSGVWTNNTGPDSVPRAEGAMVYIPASDSGLLVYFGGLTAPYDNDTMIASPMSTIYIYDIESSKWYTQTAAGDVPPSRRRFCAGAAWAPDRSSYNIYLYGGLGFGVNASGFDDVYILTLPSFTWIQWWPTSPGVGNPHNSLTCNVIDGAQMLVIGGTFPLTDACDSPPTWGTHNLDLGKQNPAGKMWNPYQPNITSYVVPSEIISVVGGSSLGGATSTAPAAGYDNRDLAVYFTQRATVASRTPTRAIPSATSATTSTSATALPTHSSTPSRGLSTGAIVGIAVGGAAVLVGLILGACGLVRRRRRSGPSQNAPGSYNTGPHISQLAQSPRLTQSPHTPYSSEDPYYITPQYQLHAKPMLAELSANQDQAQEMEPKDAVIADIRENPWRMHTDWQSPSPPHIPSPTTSHHLSNVSTAEEFGSPSPFYGSQVSPAPTYSSVGRTLRKKPVPVNQRNHSQ